jgi:hypothetical protein
MKDDHVDDDSVYTVHVTPSYPAGCKHEWHYVQTTDEHGRIINEEPTHCTKCGISFTRYIFTECP